MFITKNMFIYLIYLGLPILGRVIPTAPITADWNILFPH